LTGLATFGPAARFTQAECWAAIRRAPQFPELNARSPALLRKVLAGDNGMEGHLRAVVDLQDAFVLTPDALHARFAARAPGLAGQAAVRALDLAKLLAAQIDAGLVSTCTGYLCPGFTS
jgi:alkylresorcinol/alkylpyrone synthase